MKKIFIFGDSVMRGVMYSEKDGKYTLCSDSRFDSYKAEGFEVTNCSRMGATIKTGYDILQKKLDKIDDTSTVIFEYGGNDSDYDWSKVSENPEAVHNPKTPENEYSEIYSEMLQKAAKKGADIYMTTLVPINAESYMNFLSRFFNRKNLLEWLGDISMLYRWQEHYNMLAERISLKSGVKLIDIRSPFLVSHSYGNLLCADGIHPTEEGHTLIKQIIKKTIS